MFENACFMSATKPNSQNLKHDKMLKITVRRQETEYKQPFEE